MIDRYARRAAPLARIATARVAALAALAALSACGGGARFSGTMAEQLNRCRAEAGAIYSAASFDDYLQRVRATAADHA